MAISDCGLRIADFKHPRRLKSAIRDPKSAIRPTVKLFVRHYSSAGRMPARSQPAFHAGGWAAAVSAALPPDTSRTNLI
jgi:hypothetical protein